MELCYGCVWLWAEKWGGGGGISVTGKKYCRFAGFLPRVHCPGRKNQRGPVVKELKRFKRAKFTHIEGAKNREKASEGLMPF